MTENKPNRMTPEEEARWNERLQTVIADWISKTPNGQAVYDRYSTAIQEASK